MAFQTFGGSQKEYAAGLVAGRVSVGAGRDFQYRINVEEMVDFLPLKGLGTVLKPYMIIFVILCIIIESKVLFTYIEK